MVLLLLRRPTRIPPGRSWRCRGGRPNTSQTSSRRGRYETARSGRRTGDGRAGGGIQVDAGRGGTGGRACTRRAEGEDAVRARVLFATRVGHGAGARGSG